MGDVLCYGVVPHPLENQRGAATVAGRLVRARNSFNARLCFEAAAGGQVTRPAAELHLQYNVQSPIMLRATDQNTLHICASTFLASPTYPKAWGKDSAASRPLGLFVAALRKGASCPANGSDLRS
jgi:hypothetical protein